MTTVVWEPNPASPQVALLECPVFEVFFGGARGGGKTEGSIGDWLQHAGTYGEAATGVFFRRTFKQLEEVIARTKQLFKPLGAIYRESPKAEWEMPNGARLKFRYLERDSDAEEYQGHSYTRVYVEEVTNFPSPEPINKLRATLRSATGVPVGLRLTGNPGGPGHQWVKERYIAPAPQGYKVLKEQFKNPFDGSVIEVERVFIPSRISDNPKLMQNDPTYVARIQQQGSTELVKAWLTGDWDVVLGAYFDCFNMESHVLSMEWAPRIPSDALVFGAFDWGSSRPFCYGMYVVSDGSWGLPARALLKVREWYGAAGPNQGLKLFAGQVAEGIKEREVGMPRVRYRVADPACFDRVNGPSVAEEMGLRGVIFSPADNKRKTGWDQLRKRLVGEPTKLSNGLVLTRPMLYFLECCKDTIRTLPTLQHDEKDIEDLDTESEDHAADETRYAVMSRPWLPKQRPLGELNYPKLPSETTINDLLARRKRQRLGALQERI